MLQRPHIKAEVERRHKLARASLRMSVEEFGDLLLEASTVDPLDYYNEDGTLKPLSEIPLGARRQIASIEPVEVEIVTKVGKGKSAHTEMRTEIRHKLKLWDLRKAQELWGKWKKMYTDKVEASGADGGPLVVSININGQKKG